MESKLETIKQNIVSTERQRYKALEQFVNNMWLKHKMNLVVKKKDHLAQRGRVGLIVKWLW